MLVKGDTPVLDMKELLAKLLKCIRSIDTGTTSMVYT